MVTFASVSFAEKRRLVLHAMGIAVTLALLLAVRPWLVRAANSLVAANSAVGFAADNAFGTSSFPELLAASTGYISIPTARALLNAPRWKSAPILPPLAPRPTDRHMALAVVGMPIDTGNMLLAGRAIEQACLQDDGNVGPCGTQDLLYKRAKYGKQFNLCDFDEECWHSTAAALVAIGDGSANPFTMPGQRASAQFTTTTFLEIARLDWKDFSDSVPDGEKKPTFEQFLTERFQDFGPVLKQSVAVATVPIPGSASASAYITHPIMVERGLSPGTPLIAVNVFRGYGGNDCHDQRRGDTCLLTSTAAQEAALRYLLDRFDHSDSSSLLPAAVLLIAGGELVSTPCADAPIAGLIGDLRRRGVITFVAAGNDGKANQVRFPACAPDAVAVGSLRRDGAVANFGNGARSGLVSLYADGEVVALPLRGPRIVPRPFESVNPENCRERDECNLRDDADQYDAFLAGGTLLSAAAVSGIFLDLRHRYDDLPANAILSALKAAPAVAGTATPEADETSAIHWLDDFRRDYTPPATAHAKSSRKVTWILLAIAVIGGIVVFTWRWQRRAV